MNNSREESKLALLWALAQDEIPLYFGDAYEIEVCEEMLTEGLVKRIIWKQAPNRWYYRITEAGKEKLWQNGEQHHEYST